MSGLLLLVDLVGDVQQPGHVEQLGGVAQIAGSPSRLLRRRPAVLAGDEGMAGLPWAVRFFG